jgi:hypothetical protein
MFLCLENVPTLLLDDAKLPSLLHVSDIQLQYSILLSISRVPFYNTRYGTTSSCPFTSSSKNVILNRRNTLFKSPNHFFYCVDIPRRYSDSFLSNLYWMKLVRNESLPIIHHSDVATGTAPDYMEKSSPPHGKKYDFVKIC